MFLCLLLHLFYCLLLRLSFSFFLSLLLSWTFLFSSSFSLFPFSSSALTSVWRAPANLCRRRSVAFCPHFHSRQGPAKNGEKCIHTHTRNRRARNIGNIVEGDRWEKDAFQRPVAAVGDFFEWDARACLERGLCAWDVAPWWRVTGSVLIWDFVHVDTRCRCPLGEHWILMKSAAVPATASKLLPSILKVQLPQRRSINDDNKNKQPQHLSC